MAQPETPPFSLFDVQTPLPTPQTAAQGNSESLGSQPGILLGVSSSSNVAGHRLRQGSSMTSLSTSSSQANLIVNYIPVEVGEEEFKQLFAQFGEVESAKIVTEKSTGYSKGYGFVKYADAASAQEAMLKLDGFAMYNKRLKVGLAARQQGGNDPAGSRIVLPRSTPSADSSLTQKPPTPSTSLSANPTHQGSNPQATAVGQPYPVAFVVQNVPPAAQSGSQMSSLTGQQPNLDIPTPPNGALSPNQQMLQPALSGPHPHHHHQAYQVTQFVQFQNGQFVAAPAGMMSIAQPFHGHAPPIFTLPSHGQPLMFAPQPQSSIWGPPH
jgi:hypothetical protein